MSLFPQVGVSLESQTAMPDASVYTTAIQLTSSSVSNWKTSNFTTVPSEEVISTGSISNSSFPMVDVMATSQSIDGLAEGLADVPGVPVPSVGASVNLFGGGALSTSSPVGAPVEAPIGDPVVPTLVGAPLVGAPAVVGAVVPPAVGDPVVVEVPGKPVGLPVVVSLGPTVPVALYEGAPVPLTVVGDPVPEMVLGPAEGYSDGPPVPTEVEVG